MELVPFQSLFLSDYVFGKQKYRITHVFRKILFHPVDFQVVFEFYNCRKIEPNIQVEPFLNKTIYYFFR